MEKTEAALSLTPTKMLLFAAAVSIYCIAAISIDSATGETLLAVIVALIPAFVYVIAGGMAIHLAEGIRRRAFRDTYRPWSEDTKFLLGVIWPAVLVFWMTVGLFNVFATPHPQNSHVS